MEPSWDPAGEKTCLWLKIADRWGFGWCPHGAYTAALAPKWRHGGFNFTLRQVSHGMPTFEHGLRSVLKIFGSKWDPPERLMHPAEAALLKIGIQRARMLPQRCPGGATWRRKSSETVHNGYAYAPNSIPKVTGEGFL